MRHKNLRRKSNSVFLALLTVFCVVNVFGQKTQTNKKHINPCEQASRASGQGTGLTIENLATDSAYIATAKSDPKIYSAKIKPLKIISKPVAKYTDEALRNCVQGIIKLKVTFLANGNVGNIKVLEGLHYGLSDSAVEAAKLIKFEPEIKSNKAVTVTKKITYNFAIY